MSEQLRKPKISGHCQFPQSDDPQQSHDRCERMGGGQRWNPQKEFSPCPCPCHYPGDRYECANCGGTLAEAPLWPFDEDGDLRYTHIDPTTGRATGEECAPIKVSRNPVVVEDDDEYTGFEDPEEDDFADLLEDSDDEEDLFADMADLMEDD